MKLELGLAVAGWWMGAWFMERPSIRPSHSSIVQATRAALRGTVRDPSGIPLQGADIRLGERQASTNAEGVFLIDSLKPGEYPITIRRVGYTPLRTRVELPAGTTAREYTLTQAPVLLPTLVTEGKRTGIYGTVADPEYRAAVGARVQVIGNRGGDVLTDSGGAFAFPEAEQGAYLVRITHPGYLERRLSLELTKGEGRELAVRLTPGFGKSPSNAEVPAFQDLRLRLAMGLRRERMTGPGLARWANNLLCEMPIRAGGNPAIVVNGIDVHKNMPKTFLCFWRADEIELLEFGLDACKEASGTMRLLLRPACGGKAAPLGYIVIWEKR